MVGDANKPLAAMFEPLESRILMTAEDVYQLSDPSTAPVSAQTVFGHLVANAETAKKVLAEVIPRIPTDPTWPEHSALDSALITDRKLWPAATVKKLGPILERFA
jgi:5'-methylthioadenosine phosphorylase